MNAFTIYGKIATGSYARLIALITLGILEFVWVSTTDNTFIYARF